MLTRKEYIQLLKQDVTPALGCTKPVCVALCLAHAAKVLDEKIVSINVDVNIGIFKNGMSAGIPNFDHVGLKYAASLGAFLKNPEKGLKLFEDIDDSIKEKIYKFKRVQVHVDSTQTNLISTLTCAIEARLSGCPLNTMSSSGAGTKGIALILPIHIVAREQQIPKEKELKALALGHLFNRYINSYIGKLSPMCTCVMASSTACSAALVYMFGGNKEQIGYAIKNMTGTVTGMICDGGKVGCSLKVTTGTLSALLCAKTALNNAPLKDSDGIVASTPEKCIQNMAYLSKVGMKDVDTTIVEIMEKKKSVENDLRFYCNIYIFSSINRITFRTNCTLTKSLTLCPVVSNSLISIMGKEYLSNSSFLIGV